LSGRPLFTLLVLALFFAPLASAVTFDPSKRSGPQVPSGYDRMTICGFVAPFAFNHVVTFEDGQQAISYSPEELAALTQSMEDEVGFPISEGIVEFYIIDVTPFCGVQIFFPPEVEIPVEKELAPPPTRALSITGAVATGEPSRVGAFDIDLGESKPIFPFTMLFRIEVTEVEGANTYSLTGLRTVPALFIGILAAISVLGLLGARNRGG